MSEKSIQQLLDEEADLGNRRYFILHEIREKRGTVSPSCFGDDDCSTLILISCPWRIDCGEN